MLGALTEPAKTANKRRKSCPRSKSGRKSRSAAPWSCSRGPESWVALVQLLVTTDQKEKARAGD